VLRNSYTLFAMGSGMWLLVCLKLIRQRPVFKSRGPLNGGVLHLDVVGGPECLFALLTRKHFLTGVPKVTKLLFAGYSLGEYCFSND
jgi:hypothetical protein